MKLVYWNEKFEIGIPELDEQHQSLIDLINQLSSSINHKDGISVVSQVSEKLIQYMTLHFRDEEEVIMQCTSMPESEKRYHYQQHEMFNQHINALIDASDITDTEFSKDLLDYLSTWLISHILGADMRLAAFVNREKQGQYVDDEQSVSISQVERILLSALNESERRFRLFSDQSSTLIWMADKAGVRTFFNQSWQDHVHDKQALIEGNWQQFIHPDDLSRYTILLDELKITKHSGEIEYRLKSARGQYRHYYERIVPRFELDHTFIGHTGSAIDITHLKEAEQVLAQNNQQLEQEVKKRTLQIQEVMQMDPLTEVFNKDYVLAQLEAELKRAKRHKRPLSLMQIQLDNFREVKQKLGYTHADHILKNVAQSMNKRIRESDVIGRYNVESFLAVLPESKLADAVAFAEIINQQQDMLQYEDLGTNITLSIGIAQLHPTESLLEWMTRCQEALYQAQYEGGNQIQCAK